LTPPNPQKFEEIADKAIGYLSGAAVSALVHLGDRLGL
jgi:molybdopterin biosynthesis enzyme